MLSSAPRIATGGHGGRRHLWLPPALAQPARLPAAGGHAPLCTAASAPGRVFLQWQNIWEHLVQLFGEKKKVVQKIIPTLKHMYQYVYKILQPSTQYFINSALDGWV